MVTISDERAGGGDAEVEGEEGAEKADEEVEHGGMRLPPITRDCALLLLSFFFLGALRFGLVHFCGGSCFRWCVPSPLFVFVFGDDGEKDIGRQDSA